MSLVASLARCELLPNPQAKAHPPAYFRALCEAKATTGNDLDDYIKDFLDKPLPFTTTPGGIAALRVQAALVERAKDLREHFVETTLDDDGEGFRIVFRGDLGKLIDPFKKQVEEFCILTPVVEYGDRNAADEMAELSVYQGKAVKKDYEDDDTVARDVGGMPVRESTVPIEHYREVLESGLSDELLRQLFKITEDQIITHTEGVSSFTDENNVTWWLTDGAWFPSADFETQLNDRGVSEATPDIEWERGVDKNEEDTFFFDVYFAGDSGDPKTIRRKGRRAIEREWLKYFRDSENKDTDILRQTAIYVDESATDEAKKSQAPTGWRVCFKCDGNPKKAANCPNCMGRGYVRSVPRDKSKETRSNESALSEAKKRIAKKSGGWKTTEAGNRIFIENGKVTKGNPHVLKALAGKAGKGRKPKIKRRVSESGMNEARTATKYTIDKNGENAYLDRSGKWTTDYSAAKKFSTQDEAEAFATKHRIKDTAYGLFPTATRRVSEAHPTDKDGLPVFKWVPFKSKVGKQWEQLQGVKDAMVKVDKMPDGYFWSYKKLSGHAKTIEAAREEVEYRAEQAWSNESVPESGIESITSGYGSWKAIAREDGGTTIITHGQQPRAINDSIESIETMIRRAAKVYTIPAELDLAIQHTLDEYADVEGREVDEASENRVRWQDSSSPPHVGKAGKVIGEKDILGWFTTKALGVSGYVLARLNAEEKREFGAKSLRIYSPETGNTSIVKLNPSTGTVAYADNDHYEKTDEVKWQRADKYKVVSDYKFRLASYLGIDGADKDWANPNDEADEAAKLNKIEAKEICAEYDIPIGKDFHTLRSEEVEKVVQAAKANGYQKSKSAPGSRGRMYYEYLMRAIGDVDESYTPAEKNALIASVNSGGVQFQKFPDGGFVLHKIPGARQGTRYSAWYDSDGNPKDAEIILRNGQTRPVNKTGDVWEKLRAFGQRFKGKSANESLIVERDAEAANARALRLQAVQECGLSESAEIFGGLVDEADSKGAKVGQKFRVDPDYVRRNYSWSKDQGVFTGEVLKVNDYGQAIRVKIYPPKDMEDKLTFNQKGNRSTFDLGVSHIIRELESGGLDTQHLLPLNEDTPDGATEFWNVSVSFKSDLANKRKIGEVLSKMADSRGGSLEMSSHRTGASRGFGFSIQFERGDVNTRGFIEMVKKKFPNAEVEFDEDDVTYASDESAVEESTPPIFLFISPDDADKFKRDLNERDIEFSEDATQANFTLVAVEVDESDADEIAQLAEKYEGELVDADDEDEADADESRYDDTDDSLNWLPTDVKKHVGKMTPINGHPRFSSLWISNAPEGRFNARLSGISAHQLAMVGSAREVAAWLTQQLRVRADEADGTDLLPKNLPAFRITYVNGVSFVTSMARGVTLAKARDYYVGQSFEQPNGRMLKVVKVEEIEDDEDDESDDGETDESRSGKPMNDFGDLHHRLQAAFKAREKIVFLEDQGTGKMTWGIAKSGWIEQILNPMRSSTFKEAMREMDRLEANGTFKEVRSDDTSSMVWYEITKAPQVGVTVASADDDDADESSDADDHDEEIALLDEAWDAAKIMRAAGGYGMNIPHGSKVFPNGRLYIKKSKGKLYRAELKAGLVTTPEGKFADKGDDAEKVGTAEEVAAWLNTTFQIEEGEDFNNADLIAEGKKPRVPKKPRVKDVTTEKIMAEVKKAFADAGDEAEGDDAMSQRSLQFLASGWVSREDATLILKRALPRGYGNFRVKLLEKFPESAQFRIGREYSPVLYVKGDDLPKQAAVHADEWNKLADGSIRYWWD